MRDPQIDRAIELYGLYGTPASVFKTLKEEFGENALTPNTVRKIRETYRKDILSVRKKLEATIPLLDKHERWARLQEIVDGALEGDIIFTRNGSYTKVDRLAALNAIKVANEMATTKGVVDDEDDDLIKNIVLEAYEALKLEKPDATEDEIIKEIEESLGDKVKPFLDEIRETPLYVQ